MKNYIDKCSEKCPFVVAGMSLRHAVSAIVHWRHANSLKDLWGAYGHAESGIQSRVSCYSLTLRSCICWKNELTKMDARLTVYISAIAFFHVALQISRNGFSDELLNILMAVLGYDVDIACYSNQINSVFFSEQSCKVDESCSL